MFYNYMNIYGVEAAIRDLAHIFSSFQIITYSKSHLCPLQLLFLRTGNKSVNHGVTVA